jgi:hypothetical protein
MKSVKAGLVLLALAAQWALAGGPPPAFTAVQAARTDLASSSPKPDAGSPPRAVAANTRLVALQEPITR